MPDLVLSDISMPAMSGFELLERLTALEPRFAKMPFVFLTALTDRDNELKGRQLGADDYVTKPIDFDVLTTIINARLAGVARSELWPKLVQLNDREVETLTWVARGKTSAEIAQILGLTKRTVDFHIDNARTKLAHQADGRFSHRQRTHQARRGDPHPGRHQGGDRPRHRAVARASARGRASPHEDGERQREGSDNKTKVDPGSISLGIFGKHEEVEQDPQPDGDSQGEPDEVTRGLIGGPNAFVLRRADARNHHQQRPDE